MSLQQISENGISQDLVRVQEPAPTMPQLKKPNGDYAKKGEYAKADRRQIGRC